MNAIFFEVFTIIEATIAFVLAGVIFSKKRKKADFYLGFAVIFSAIVVLTYLTSAFHKNYLMMSIFSSLYFGSITLMLYFLLNYIIVYTKVKDTKRLKVVKWVFRLWGIEDLLALLINPFKEIVISYNYRPGNIAIWQYEQKFLYKMHLLLCYLLVALIFFYLLYRATKTPSAYRVKFTSCFVGIFLIVGMNMIFLIFQKEDMLDYSVMFYGIMGFFFFWNRYYYSHHGMLARVRQMILNELDQPVLLFDDEDELAMCNTLAKKFVDENEHLTLQQFSDLCSFPQDITDFKDNIHFQWTYSAEEKSSYRVDIKRLRDYKDRTIGKLLVMTDTSLEMDLLTGFHSKSSFEGYFSKKDTPINYPVGVIICDLNKLTQINKKFGTETGDLAIQQLARLMTLHFPKDSYFARLDDANLIAICPATNEENIRKSINELEKDLKEIKDFELVLEMQSAVSVATTEKPDVIEAVDTAMFSMRSKKLMDGNSAHSSLMDSLAQTLLESDDTTKAHVARTRDMGELLGKRLDFTDAQLSNLALLCLLHDIGKLGIPLEILNKPGKLNAAEWEVMKSHVEKGYRIAKASPELESIADLILHHHESWNGKGYPDGLKGESIPLLSRVIAVVDTYDAMTNDRPYHKAVSDMEAREELRRCAGVQFDPKIVSEFLKLLEEIHPEAEEKNVSQFTERQPGNEVGDTLGVKEIFSEKKETLSKVQAVNYAKYTTGEDGKIFTIDDNFTELTGYNKEDVEVCHLNVRDLIPPADLDIYMDFVVKGFNSKNAVYLEHRILRKDGTFRDVICFGKQIYDSVTRRPQVDIVMFDISQTNAFMTMQRAERESARRSIEKWENLTRKDSLTGLLNHESFINDVEKALANKDQIVVLMILDVDYFKNYNDSFGHLAGDRLLALVAIMLETAVKEFGFAGRLGGDEFAAILKVPKGTSDEKIRVLVEDCFEKVMEATNSKEQGATISLGAAYIKGEDNFNHLYQEADYALYRAKEKGRKCFSF